MSGVTSVCAWNKCPQVRGSSCPGDRQVLPYDIRKDKERPQKLWLFTTFSDTIAALTRRGKVNGRTRWR